MATVSKEKLAWEEQALTAVVAASTPEEEEEEEEEEEAPVTGVEGDPDDEEPC